MPTDPSTATAATTADEPESSTMWHVVQQAFLFWVLSQIASTVISYTKPAVTPTPGSPNDDPAALDPRNSPPQTIALGWPLGQTLDMHVHLSTSPNGDVFSKQWTSGWREDQDAGLPNFVWENITFGDYNTAPRAVHYNVEFPQSVLNNGSLWADIFLVKNNSSPNPQDSSFAPENVHHVRKLLTRYLPRPKIRREINLLSGQTTVETGPKETEGDVIVPHWHPNVTLALVSDASPLAYKSIQAPLMEHIEIIPDLRDETGKQGFYKPIIFMNEFWHLRSQYIEVNQSTPTLPLHIVFQPMGIWKFQAFAAMGDNFKKAEQQQGPGTGAEMDEFKRMLLETNPWFLGLTGLVSILHVLFEMLAFKSDVSHWRQKKELVGVSVRTIITNVIVQFIILLYLIDNNDNTSWMILFGSGMGVVIEAWKITKAVDIALIPSTAGSLIPYKLLITDQHVLSDDEKKTQEYDKLAYKYVSYVAIPTLAAYTGYSLKYESHKGWYSFIISTLTSFVYMFGFAQLVPQLIINYKLKSVSHMPMKSMIYKTLSTVVDDLFAFCIKMPFLHRLAAFRDDVVFLIFLYQRWIYRIDPKRVNEYGQVLVEGDEVAGESKKDK